VVRVKVMASKIQIPALRLRAEIEPASIDVEAREVDVVWTTGARVLRGFWDRFWEELSLDPRHVRLRRLNNGAPLLDGHRGDSAAADVMGVVVSGSAKLAGKKGTARVRFSPAGVDERADRLFEKVRAGIVQNVSVGYRVHKLEKVEDGADKIPVMRATDWEPYEVSAAAMGADDGAGFRAAAPGVELNDCEFLTRGDEPQQLEVQVTEEEIKAAEAKRQAEHEAQRKAAVEAERKRSAGIRVVVRRAGLDEALADELVNTGKTVDEAREAVLDKLAERSERAGPSQVPAGGGVQVVVDERDKRRGFEVAWLIAKAGRTAEVEKAKKNERVGHLLRDVQTDPGPARGMRLAEMARGLLERNRVSTSGLDQMALVGRALQFRDGPYQGTDTFPVLFEQALGKILLASYVTADDTWRFIAETTTVSDFRDSPRYRQGAFGVLDVLNENGEFRTKPIPDGQKIVVQTETRGNIISLTRQAIINDDMVALGDLAARFGRAAGLTLEVSLYLLINANGGLGPTLSDANPFFHTSRGNINTVGSALSVDGLDADRVVLGKQKEPNSEEYIVQRPDVLLVPLELGGAARVVVNSEKDPSSGKYQVTNKVANIVRTIVDTPRVTGTRRYMFAKGADSSAYKAVFLEGTGETPYMEMKDGFDVDGTSWKVRLDAKMCAFDPKAGVTNAGA